MDIELVAMNLVGNSGESRSLAFEALADVKRGNFKEAEEKMALSKERILQAHEMQTELIVKEADGEKVEVGLLMVHAQDHLMTSMLARDLIVEIMELHKGRK